MLNNMFLFFLIDTIKIKNAVDFSKETLEARRGWKEVFQVPKGKDLQLRLLYPAKLSL